MRRCRGCEDCGEVVTGALSAEGCRHQKWVKRANLWGGLAGLKRWIAAGGCWYPDGVLHVKGEKVEEG